jgi:hypothetical protein
VLYRAVLDGSEAPDGIAATKFLRTKNTSANHLGLALPSGHVSTFAVHGDTPLLLDEAPFNDTAVNEDMELPLGDSDDVRVFIGIPDDDGAGTPSPPKRLNLPKVPGVKNLRSLRISSEGHIEVSNAGASAANVEVSVRLPDGVQVVGAAPMPTPKDGLPTFKVTVPAYGRYTVRLQFGLPPD